MYVAQTGADRVDVLDWAVYDDDRDRVYANIREPAEISVIA